MPLDQTDIAALFDRAARHAASFRAALAAHLHRVTAGYADAVAAFAAPTPEHGMAPEEVLDELARRAEPGLATTTGGRFFGWVIGGSHPMGVAADWLTAAWGQNAGNHTAAPAAAAAETAAAAWLLDLLDLPRESSVGFVTGATMANFVGLAAARDDVLRRAGWDLEARGLFGAPPIRVLIGEDAHTTVLSALRYLGFGRDSLLRIATDAQGATRADAFATAVAASHGPTIAITQAGQINTGAFDPHREIVAAAHAAGAWVHVDGAFGLWARACPDRAPLARGVEQADSWATDGHKWLQTPYDCGYAIVKDAEAHRRAMTIAASYLPPVAGRERDPSHLVPELSRRARGFATWAMIRHLGRDGIAAMVRRHCDQARLFADCLGEERGIAIRNEVVLNQVLVQFGADHPAQARDALTQAAIRAVQADATCFAGGALWRGEWVMRLSVIGAATTDADIRASAAAICRCWRQVQAETDAPG